MTDNSDSAPGREDARDLQAKLYRDVGIAAVAAALDVPADEEPAGQLCMMDQSTETHYRDETLAA